MWTHRVAALGSDVWQKRNRSSLRPFPKAYLLAILQLGFSFALCLSKQAAKSLKYPGAKGVRVCFGDDEVKATGQSDPA